MLGQPVSEEANGTDSRREGGPGAALRREAAGGAAGHAQDESPHWRGHGAVCGGRSSGGDKVGSRRRDAEWTGARKVFVVWGDVTVNDLSQVGGGEGGKKTAVAA